MAVAAHPGFLAGGIAYHEGIVGDVLGHDAAGSNETVAAQRHPADDRGVRADRGPATDHGLLVEVVPVDLAAGIGDVGQNTGRPQEDVVLNRGSRIDRDVVLNLDVVADDNPTSHIDILPEDAILPNPGPSQYMTKVPDLGASADNGSIIDIRGLVREVVGSGLEGVDG